MNSLREEDMFGQSQPFDEEAEKENVYLELEKALTERKCRIIQKKQKIKLVINGRIRQDEELKRASDEEKRFKKEIEEVNDHKNTIVRNIENEHQSRSTLEFTLCHLTNNLSKEKEETKRMKSEFDAGIKDAHDTWKLYKEKYENFPLAKKRREVEVEIKKVEIVLKQAEVDTTEYMRKKQLKREIAERRFQLSVVQLAETYKVYQQLMAEQKELMDKMLKLKTRMADLESGKTTTRQVATPQTSSTQGKEQRVVQKLPEVVKFTVSGLGLQVMSPPQQEADTLPGRSLFSWSELLGTSAKTSTRVEKIVPTTSVGSSTVTSTPQKPRDEPQLHRNMTSSMKLMNLLRNVPGLQKKPALNVGVKRNSGSNDDKEVNKEDRPPVKKSIVSTPHSTKVCEPSVTKSYVKVDNPPAVKRDEWLDRENKENTNSKMVISSSKSQTLPTGDNMNKLNKTPASKALSQNLMNILSMKGGMSQKSNSGHTQDTQEDGKATLVKAPVISQNHQQGNFNEVMYQNSQAKRDEQDKPIENFPSSPAPDLIPVETNSNSQPLSQGNISQTCSPIEFNLSGGSDFISPIDETTKMAYQRLMAQAGPYPTQEYSAENSVNSHKPPSEENIVRSHYFIGSPSLNTPPDGPVNDYQPGPLEPFSPPMIEGAYDSNDMMAAIQSPPPANTAAYCENENPSNSSGPAFSFVPKSLNNKPKTVFDFF
ncbi:uncharacterized protein LOC129005174 isoform X2 [Macrosteles quadrilineatus]|uniref:uncharacterized protein LOC129005174 isoform X2 n=1 Tax=Macrosteles quadrilineatus TaxID=74068 RepID=UPI0023E283C3|nr:uncharacterized protein LOC129005174 isoform X2 [Macrosteles quadrilineatus]